MNYPRAKQMTKILAASVVAAGLVVTGPVTSTAVLANNATVAIADIQGTSETSPLAGQTVTTRGVVTAVYAQGGINGFVIQTPGTGGEALSERQASTGLFVYAPSLVGEVALGDFVEVTGAVSEYREKTQISVRSGGLKHLNEAAAAPKAFEGAFPEDTASRELLESMLIQPGADMVVTDNYGTNTYGEVTLVNGTEPIRQYTDFNKPDATGYAEYEETAKARTVVLDDGATLNFMRNANAKDNNPLPYLSTKNPVLVGAGVTFTQPVVVDYSFDLWRFQPTTFFNGEESLQPVQFDNIREAAPAQVGSDLTVSSFNVLNYFTTLGDTDAGCKAFTDRANNPITTNNCNPRGAFDEENFKRQQSKIVQAINTLDAKVLGLEEIENSAAFGHDRDHTLRHLVDALNAAAGTNKWAFVPSPAQVPHDEDVIRTAFIYQPASVETVGESQILLDSPAFGNAREPLAQAFRPAGSTATDGSDTFVAVVNHFKSKGSGSGAGNEDSGDGQGSSNADRVAQAKATIEFTEHVAEQAGTTNTLVLGDLNSYTEEDPMQEFYAAGYTNIGKATAAGNTYLFGGRVGSLDHVLANGELFDQVTGADVWNINSVESIALEYSRYNYNVKDLWDGESPYRASDHDPLLVGLDLPVENNNEPAPVPSEEPSGVPTGEPSTAPTSEPSTSPAETPSSEATAEPSSDSTAPGNSPAPDHTPTAQAPTAQAPDQGDSGKTGTPDQADQPAGDDEQGTKHAAQALPRTGTTVLVAVIVGLAAIAIGVVGVWLGRRRK